MATGLFASARWKHAIDAVLVVALVTAGEAELLSGSRYDGAGLFPGPRAVNIVLVVVLVAPLLWRRSRPLTSCLTVLVGLSVASLALGGAESGALFILFLVAVYSGAVYAGRPWVIAGAGVATATMHTLRDPHVQGVGDVVFAFGLAAVGWLLGRAIAGRQDHIGLLERHAAEVGLRHSAEVAAARSAERAAIARDLHDIVAHAVSVIVIQAQAGRLALPERPEMASDVLATIEGTGRSALNELRRLLVVLQDEEEGTDAGRSPAVPAPTLGDVDALVETVRSTGLAIMVHRPDRLPDLPLASGLALYRVVQESLTNTMRHAPGATATLWLRRTPARFEVEVADTGPVAGAAAQPRRDGCGRGLIGMQERMSLVGGALDYGVESGGGFSVRASVPVADLMPDGPPAKTLSDTG